ncbi:unnamed protein product [Zymoseptoria tritici ST99CH_1A5]|uniref:Uncharacterized protein n=1 Tax=Zymoseptoria tritici ST99CH_1A5 TaxID=1276529 RepID=A0A1Y6LF72_ZYMTR|nr:unnamed protein product [Zymoseptoria tritici ST99CH_3D1]SMY22289.1 unnamed protein product [Zymoseptoria tritici ST99CH_1A5]
MWAILALAMLATKAFAFGRRSIPPQKVDGPWQVEHGEFAQLIDHNNPSLGTFQQSYWYNYHFYQGPGSPIVLFSPSHWNGTDGIGFIFNVTTMGRMAQELGGAAINIEHRVSAAKT